MAYDVSALSAYTKEFEAQLVTKAHFGAKTQSLILAAGILLTGVKSAEKIPIMDTDVVFQVGGTCGFSSSGTTTFTDRTVTVGKIKVNEALCPKSLETKATQKELTKGSRPNSIPFEKEYSEQKAAITAEQLEAAIWQGDTGSGNANLSKFDGIIKLADAVSLQTTNTNARLGSGTITSNNAATTFVGVGTTFTTELGVGDKVYGISAGTYTLIGTIASITNDLNAVLVANGAITLAGVTWKVVRVANAHFATPITAITAANVISVIDAIWTSLPARLINKDDIRILTGWDVFQTYVKALRDLNLFHYSADTMQNGEVIIPGTAYKVVAVHGLNTTSRVYGLRLSNLALAVDMENEDEKFEIFYAKEADEVRYVSEFKMGVNFALPADIVSFRTV